MIRFTLEGLEQADNDLNGFCTVCGCMASNVEPDARGYQCENCKQMSVYGAEELILMGAVKAE